MKSAPMSALSYAVKTQNVAEVEAMLKDPQNTQDKNNLKTPLRYAIEKGNKEIVALLLAAGADRNSLDKGLTPLECAIWSAQGEHPEIVSMLLEAGADPNLKFKNTTPPTTPLHYAIHKNYAEIASILQREGGHLEKEGFTPLSYAVDRHHTKTVFALLKNAELKEDKETIHILFKSALIGGQVQGIQAILDTGIDPNEEISQDRRPLHYAIRNQHLAIVIMLQRAGALCNTQNKGTTPLEYAVKKGQTDFVIEMLKNMDWEKESKADLTTPLCTAIQEKNFPLVEALLAAGADPNKADKKGFTPLYHAVKQGQSDIMILLQKAGANCNTLEEKATTVTPLDAAILKNRLDLAEILLANADWNREDKRTLIFALCTAIEKNNKEMLQLLLNNGADPNQMDESALTALANAALHKRPEP